MEVGPRLYHPGLLPKSALSLLTGELCWVDDTLRPQEDANTAQANAENYFIQQSDTASERMGQLVISKLATRGKK